MFVFTRQRQRQRSHARPQVRRDRQHGGDSDSHDSPASVTGRRRSCHTEAMLQARCMRHAASRRRQRRCPPRKRLHLPSTTASQQPAQCNEDSPQVAQLASCRQQGGGQSHRVTEEHIPATCMMPSVPMDSMMACRAALARDAAACASPASETHTRGGPRAQGDARRTQSPSPLSRGPHRWWHATQCQGR